ncbi:MAG: hypothetical protein NC038_07770 [Paludibacter sp.]|nr:hypothetical protein [Prevotella sp.]MCM1443640.1 hypothetical protein [Muribaculum sp.]MCM1482515.1 hypothetical protein [Paludibacter sp.]MCM1576891.1 hypothetical protein [Bacteroides sp.]
MEVIQKTNPAMSGKKVRKYFRKIANIIPANAVCAGAMETDGYEMHVQFNFGDTLITLYMSEGGAI